MSNQIASFVRLDSGEKINREYYITHSSKRRFSVGMILLVLVSLIPFVVPGLALFIYFAVRRLRISHGYACSTNKRVIYYEFNDHPEENYHSIDSVHLEDVTAMHFKITRTLMGKSFDMTLWTTKSGLTVGATSTTGILKYFIGQSGLEPGPEALEFVQDMSGEIAERKKALI